MIYIDNIRNPRASEVWAIVRSLRNPGKMIQVPDLSPTKELFYQYLKWRDAGQWNKKTFEEQYVPKFIEDAKANPNFERYIQYLRSVNRDISLVCFCTDESMCHRAIIAGILQGWSVPVMAQNDYRAYCSMYYS